MHVVLFKVSVYGVYLIRNNKRILIRKRMNSEDDIDSKAVTTASLPMGLKRRFENMPTRDEYMNFSDFVRRKVEIAIIQEERLATWAPEDTEGDLPHTQPKRKDTDSSR